jgi:hypothetical protein
MWWKKALLWWLGWTVFVMVLAGTGAWYITHHPLPDYTVDQRIDDLAGLAGNAMGGGLVVAFLLAYRSQRPWSGSRGRRGTGR